MRSISALKCKQNSPIKKRTKFRERTVIATHKKAANIAGGIALGALALLMLGQSLMAEPTPSLGMGLLFQIIVYIFAGAYFYGIWEYVRAKNRSGWWALLGLLSVIGLIAVLVLEDRSPATDA